MKSTFRHLPEWLAILPGLAAGWFFTARVDSQMDRMEHPPHPSRATFSASDPSVATHAVGKLPELRMATAKLAVLRNARRNLGLNFKSFTEDSRSSTESAFEILRRVIDLTPAEESALRAELQRSADALREYEKTHLTDFSVQPGHLSFRLPAGGDFLAKSQAGIADVVRSILGETRATIFEAITRTRTFTGLTPSFDGFVEMHLISNQSTLQIQYADGGRRWTLSSSASSDPQTEEFGRFGHLLDLPSRRIFFDKTPTD